MASATKCLLGPLLLLGFWLVLLSNWRHNAVNFASLLTKARDDAASWTFPLDPCYRDLKLIASSTYMAQSDSWQSAPFPGHKSPRQDKDQAPFCLAQRLLKATGPLVMFVETRYLEEFVDLLEGNRRETQRFVIVTAGSDVPLRRELQGRLAKLPGFCAAYATNLHRPTERQKDMFHPLPVGFLPNRLTAHNEALLITSRAAAPPWSRRSERLLVPWMRMQCGQRWRRGYRTVLEALEYRDLVKVVDSRLPFPDYLEQLGSHRVVLSPPGKGYDCTRTWESVWMGCKPLVYNDTDFDTRHYQRASVSTIPHPDDLSPDLLRKLMDSQEDPSASDSQQLYIEYWTSRWQADLHGASTT
ncbi:unnamed protein product [Symbiodinium sp. CCMP2456]|nr:unnamed protein product [Symbiodinium sp. CCMP2456]